MSNSITQWEDIPKKKIKKKKQEVTESIKKFNKNEKYDNSFKILLKLSNRIETQIKSNQPIKKVDDIINLLSSPSMLRAAFSKISRNKGSMTPGTTGETADEFSEEKLLLLSESLLNGTFQWKPVKRIQIPKPGKKKKRPLGLPDFSDKIVQECIRIILDSIYEPEFNKYDCNYGFRSKHDCISAIRRIRQTGQSADYAIEGDIQGAYDNVDHDILLLILQSKISDKKFIRLIKSGLQAGIFENNKIVDSFLGVPQGSIASPILFNIYMHEFDKYIIDNIKKQYDEDFTGKIPITKDYYLLTSKSKRKKKLIKNLTEKNISSKERLPNFLDLVEIIKLQPESFQNIDFCKDFPKFENELKIILESPKNNNLGNKYSKFRAQLTRHLTDEQYELIDKLRLELSKTLLSQIMNERLHTEYRDINRKQTSIRYFRYADDWIILVSGNLETTNQILQNCNQFFNENLKLKLSPEKTLITCLNKNNATFLGFSIYFPKHTFLIKNKNNILTRSRPIQIEIDKKRLENKFKIKGYLDSKNNKPREIGWLSVFEDHQIINKYNQFMLGLGNYYVTEVSSIYKINRWHYILYYSCLKTLATKFKISIAKVIKKYGFLDKSNPINSNIPYRKLPASELRICCSYKIDDKIKWHTLLNYKEFLFKILTYRQKYRSRISLGLNTYTPTIDFISLNKMNFRTKFKLTSFCSICGSTNKLQNHHIKPIKHSSGKWTGYKGFDKLVASLGRKQLTVCFNCHKFIHSGQYNGIGLDELYDSRLIIPENYIDVTYEPDIISDNPSYNPINSGQTSNKPPTESGQIDSKLIINNYETQQKSETPKKSIIIIDPDERTYWNSLYNEYLITQYDKPIKQRSPGSKNFRPTI